MSDRYFGPLRRMIGMADDVPPVRRGVELPVQSEADAMRFLGDLSEQDAAFRTRFGFDPDTLYQPIDNVAVAARRMDAGVPAQPSLGLESPLFPQMSRSQDAFDNLRKGRTANLRNQPFAQPAGAAIRDAAADSIREMQAAIRNERLGLTGAAAGAAGLGAMVLGTDANMRRPVGADVTASAPPPSGPTTSPPAPGPVPPSQPAPTGPQGLSPDEQAFADRFKRQLPGHEAMVGPAYKADRLAMQAKQMLEDLNARRRAAGGEVPDAALVQAQADAMLGQANAIRNDPGFRPLPQQGVPGQKAGARQQAIAMLQALNADRQRAGGEVPDAAARMAAIQSLLAQADEQESFGTADLAAESRPLP